jgi:hypothetical protein
MESYLLNSQTLRSEWDFILDTIKLESYSYLILFRFEPNGLL